MISTGRDFHDNDNNPEDNYPHGTNCAGIIGATGNNGIGIAGVMHRVKIISLKYYNTLEDPGYTSDTIDCIL